MTDAEARRRIAALGFDDDAAALLADPLTPPEIAALLQP